MLSFNFPSCPIDFRYFPQGVSFPIMVQKLCNFVDVCIGLPVELYFIVGVYTAFEVELEYLCVTSNFVFVSFLERNGTERKYVQT